MITHQDLKSITLIIASMMLCVANVHADVSSTLSSRFLSRGERALLQIAIIGDLPSEAPKIPSIEGIEIRPTGLGPDTNILPGRRLVHVYEYMISSYEVGKHTLPAITVNANGTTESTAPIEFEVFNPDELKWENAKAGDTQFKYASTFRVLDDQPFEGESIPVEIKLYVPRDLFVIDWGIPDFERDGVTAWRFEPSEMRGQTNLLGMQYISVAYPSILTPTRSGEIGIGPATIRLINTQVIMDGILRRVSVETNIDVPKLVLRSKELPKDAPEGFSNAVGNFDINVTTPETEVQEGDPIPVEIVVRGSGNLNSLTPPEPIKKDGWKIYETSSLDRGNERRNLSGTAVFNQFLRPLEIKGAIPAYKLVYFDPVSEEYKTAKTEPINLKMLPAPNSVAQSTGPPPSLAMPVEQMTDILGLIPNPSSNTHASPIKSSWLIHSIGIALALLLILKAVWMRFGHLFDRDPDLTKRENELRAIERKSPSDYDFLMATGRFAERWHGNTANEEIQKILKERDEHCFRPDHSSTPSLSQSRRKSILQTLRKASIAIVIATITCLSSNGMASESQTTAREAYQEARYSDAVETWLNSDDYSDLSADTLYHIGNACYRAGSAGYASLYYRRALARDPSHAESLQNLRFIERKYGALTIQRPEYQFVITRIPLEVWKQLTWAGLWICVLGALAFPATRPGANIRALAIVALICGPMFSLCAGLGWRYFPRDTEFTPLVAQAVIVQDNQTLFTDASRTSTEVIEAPVGSLCEIIHQSGRWAYISFATKTHGWIPIEAIEKVIPDDKPTVPKISKPKADDNSA